ncbi:S-adenosyl-L-methionine-dependent methyltransferase [Colletotrichum cereale]|nr:S-adenosyl-L-methionine-dependent methyltransferase [Colletotrichum cereale]
MLHVATRAKCPSWRLPPNLSPILQRPASTRPARQTAKPLRFPAKPYFPRHAHPASNPSPTSRVPLETAETIFRARKVPLLASGVVALGLGIYLSLLASSLYSSPCCQCPEPSPDAVPIGRPSVFTEESARRFDQSLDGSEWLMGVTALRQKMATEASGHVLEVAIGTGRNLPFYDWGNILQSQSKFPSSMGAEATVANIERKPLDSSSAPILSYTGVDISSEMLGVATEKLVETVPRLAGVAPRVVNHALPTQSEWGLFSYLSDRVRIFRSDIHDFIPPPPEQLSTLSKYDFVCSTFSLCSVRDPEQIVRDLANMVKPGTGRIILVEHGRGWSGFVNGLLDKSAASHFQKYGCWWNRDIAEIVESASKSLPGLEVVKVERPYLTQLGTTLWVELRVSRT